MSIFIWHDQLSDSSIINPRNFALFMLSIRVFDMLCACEKIMYLVFFTLLSDNPLFYKFHINLPTIFFKNLVDKYALKLPKNKFLKCQANWIKNVGKIEIWQLSRFIWGFWTLIEYFKSFKPINYKNIQIGSLYGGKLVLLRIINIFPNWGVVKEQIWTISPYIGIFFGNISVIFV